MGTDIHAWVERKERDGWRSFRKPIELGRPYVVFELMAGVRDWLLPCMVGAAEMDQQFTNDAIQKAIGDGLGPFGQLPKGLPDDASSVVASEHERYGSDAHSASWLSLSDLQRVADQYAALPFVSFVHDAATSGRAWRAAAKEHGVKSPEAMELFDKMREQHVTTGNRTKSIDRVLRWMRCLESSGTPTRLVFFFDN